jgi:N-acetylneuraminic acid mutarotase
MAGGNHLSAGTALFFFYLGLVSIGLGHAQWMELAPQNFEFASNAFFGEVPATRYSHCAVADPETNSMYISHGYFYDHRNHHPTWLADTWAFDVEEGSWGLVHAGNDAAPEPRYGHACVFFERKIYLFGGDGDPGNAVSAHGSLSMHGGFFLHENACVTLAPLFTLCAFLQARSASPCTLP